MLIICDYRAPQHAIEKLKNIGELVLFNNKLLAPMPLHGHPDIFVCQTPEKLIVAPNIEKKLLNQLETSNISYIFGDLPIEIEHPFIARYNAIVTSKVTICNPNTVDPKILESSANNRLIQVKQSYNRCSTIALSDESFLTSDVKTHQQLLKNGFESLHIDSKAIALEGYSHGLFGGCVGINKQTSTMYTVGSLHLLPNYSEIIALIHKKGLSVCCLTNAPLQDVGGLFFCE